ncbi:uncharacterized protein [Miscanthus floridulus]|uniref:uncharacterized protein isoform X2 n=1 Tax=Miscanthus floridulus TaxID=154761 RepID=UPI003458F325
MPKIKVIVNELGQPVGDNYRKFSSAVGCHVRRKLSVACPDWRKVDIKKKMAVWTDLKEIYDIDDEAFPWFLNAAAKKWKEFKSNLKKQFFYDKLTEQQLRKIHGERLNDDDWNKLKEYWASEESEVAGALLVQGIKWVLN